MGLKRFPSQKLALICYDHDNSMVNRFLEGIELIDKNTVALNTRMSYKSAKYSRECI